MIHLNVLNNTVAAQNVTITSNVAPYNILAGPTAVAAGATTDIYNVPDANVTLRLVCNGNNGQAATLNVVYHGASSVEQDGGWVRQWHVDGAPTGLILTLT
jgi:hypothetical protein